MQAISNFMTSKMITVDESADLASAYRLMLNNKIRHLPVLNKDREVVGLLSDRDLLRALKTQVIHQPGFKIEDAKFDPTDIVYEYMSRPVKTFDVKTPIDRVVRGMINDKISCYLISDNEGIVGLVTTENFLQLLLSYLAKDDSSSWSLEKILSTPWIQSASNSLSQAGI
ncbi:MAG: CBS domain-containing protein [Bdellovibrionota bacterium]